MENTTPSDAQDSGRHALTDADRPRESYKEDEFGYSPFAKRLADSILRMNASDGFVMAIYGPWGAGKTTLLNFIRGYIADDRSADTVQVFPFNPWWFSGHEDLVKTFFAELDSLISGKKRFRGLRKKLTKFSEAVGESPIPYSSAWKTLSKFLQTAEETVPQLKARIGEELKRNGIRLLVVIDDIDRLTADEIRQLFKVVKAIADFPNTIYLLAFDRNVAVDAINQSQGVTKGAAYLEKIVQDAHEMPLPDRESLGRMFIERLNVIIDGTPDALTDETRFAALYNDGIARLIQTPRHLIRMINSISVSYLAVNGEVATEDFIATEALRIMLPDVWNTIRNNPTMFAGGNEYNNKEKDQQALKAFHDDWINNVDPRMQEIARNITGELFPKIPFRNYNTIYGRASEAEWRKARRVCSLSEFPLYFGSALGEQEIPHSEMSDLLKRIDDPPYLRRRLLEMSKEVGPNGTTRAERFLIKLQDYTGYDIPPKAIPGILSLLFDIGDELSLPDIDRDALSVFMQGPDTQIGRIVYQLAIRLSQAERFELFRPLFSQGASIYTIARRAMTFAQEHGKFGGRPDKPDESRTVSQDQLYTLEQVIAGRIRDAALEGRLPSTRRTIEMHEVWSRWGSMTEVQDYLSERLASEARLLSFVENAVFFQHGNKNERIAQVGLAQLRPMLDIDSLMPNLRVLAERANLSEPQRMGVELFIQEYEMHQTETSNNGLGFQIGADGFVSPDSRAPGPEDKAE